MRVYFCLMNRTLIIHIATLAKDVFDLISSLFKIHWHFYLKKNSKMMKIITIMMLMMITTVISTNNLIYMVHLDTSDIFLELYAKSYRIYRYIMSFLMRM